MHKYYYKDLDKLINFLVPTRIKTLHLKQLNGKLINTQKGKYDYIILNNLVGDLSDVQKSLDELNNLCTQRTKILITYYNHLWEPLLKLGSILGWRKSVGEQNWLDNDDLENLLEIANFEVITRQKRMLVPIYIPFFSDFINKWIAPLPLINSFCLTTWIIAKPKALQRNTYSVSIVIPARNEEGNIPQIIPSIPKFSKSQEIIFIEGHSKDDTWSAIKKEIANKKRRGLKVKALKQKGKGKADAVKLGFSKATGDILMILDADMSVAPCELKKFYNILANGKGEFVNGSRLVYPMEKEAMRALNKAGNKIFSWLFTWILGQRFKDTLCGTKVLFRKDYQSIVENRKIFGDFDPFGDFDLIFGAIKLNLKVVEVPIRYKERQYGSTNINRFAHGLLLLKMTVLAYKKFRSW